jgi:hypothetical protein
MMDGILFREACRHIGITSLRTDALVDAEYGLLALPGRHCRRPPRHRPHFPLSAPLHGLRPEAASDCYAADRRCRHRDRAGNGVRDGDGYGSREAGLPRRPSRWRSDMVAWPRRGIPGDGEGAPSGTQVAMSFELNLGDGDVVRGGGGDRRCPERVAPSAGAVMETVEASCRGRRFHPERRAQRGRGVAGGVEGVDAEGVSGRARQAGECAGGAGVVPSFTLSR